MSWALLLSPLSDPKPKAQRLGIQWRPPGKERARLVPRVHDTPPPPPPASRFCSNQLDVRDERPVTAASVESQQCSSSWQEVQRQRFPLPVVGSGSSPALGVLAPCVSPPLLSPQTSLPVCAPRFLHCQLCVKFGSEVIKAAIPVWPQQV